MITSTKMVNCNNLFYRYIYSCTYSDKLKLANGDSLYYSFMFTIFGGPARFYHRLINVLDEGGYFNEDN